MRFQSIFIATNLLFLLGCQITTEKQLSGYTFSNEIVIIQPSNQANYTGDLTIDMYIKLNSYPTTWTSIISKFQSDHINEFNLRLKDSDTGHWYYGPGDRAFVMSWIPQEVIPLNEWVRLTAIRDTRAKTQRIKINGEVVAERRFSTAPPAMSSNSKIYIMGGERTSLNGVVSEIRIWGKALKETELNNTANTVRRPGREKNLIGYWKFSAVSEDKKVKDLSGNNQDGEIISLR